MTDVIHPDEKMLHTEKVVALSAVTGLNYLHPDDVAAIAQHARERFFPEGTVIYEEGAPLETFIIITRGAIATSRHGHVLRTMRAGQTAGSVAALGQHPDGLRAEAVEDTFGFELNAAIMREVLEDNFTLLANVLRGMATEIIEARRKFGGAAGYPPPVESDPVDLPEHLDPIQRLMYLRGIMQFAHGRIEALGELAQDSEDVRVEAGHVFWREGDRSDQSFNILSGTVEARTKDGHVFGFGPGDSMGGLDGVARQPRWYSAVALTPVVALGMSVETFLDVLEDNPDLGITLLELMSQGVDDLYERLAGHADHAEASSTEEPP